MKKNSIPDDIYTHTHTHTHTQHTPTHTAVHHICRRPILALQIAIPSHKLTRTSRQFPLPPRLTRHVLQGFVQITQTQVADGSVSAMAAIFILAVILQVITGMFSHVCISLFHRTFLLSSDRVAQFYSCHIGMGWVVKKERNLSSSEAHRVI